MSEQNKGKTTSSISTIVATAIVALLAVAAIIVLIVISKKPNEEQTPQNSLIVDSADGQALADECGENAQTLVAGNYRIVRLFVSEGLPHKDEPYGNRPEDGYYTAVSDEFKTYEELDAYVRSIFTFEEASRILLKMPSDPADAQNSNLVSIYKPRDEYVDAATVSSDGTASASGGASYVKQSVLGINARFKPNTDYKKPWGSISIKILPVNEEECDITIYLGADKDVDFSSVEDSDILHTKMIKENGEWRLTQLVF